MSANLHFSGKYKNRFCVIGGDSKPLHIFKVYLLAFLVTVLVAQLCVLSYADATHTVITSEERRFSPIGISNEKRVYLSSPRHKNSGRRGELGWEENINGRHWNYYAATGNYYKGKPSTSTDRNFRSRGYKVVVSPNSRDNGYMRNLEASDSWGADVHIATHTNAGRGNYMLVMVDDSTATNMDRKLQSKIVQAVGSVVPGREVQATDASGYTNGRDLAELSADAKYTVYVELFFHDNQTHVDWFGSGNDWGAAVKHHAWLYGYAVDQALGSQ